MPPERTAKTWPLRSKGYATDLFIAGFDGEVSASEHYRVARTPSNPTFWWGNFILFPNPPSNGDLPLWEAAFTREFGGQVLTTQHLFAWDAIAGERGMPDEFLAAGYNIEESCFLALHAPAKPPHFRADVIVRPLVGAEEWITALKLHQAANSAEQNEPEFLEFQELQWRRSRRMADARFATFYGAFLGNVMVATMGLVAQGRDARCQAVATHPDYQRRGFCATLVHQVCAKGLATPGTDRILIQTDPEGDAVRVYRSVGFELVERVMSVHRLANDAPA